MQTFLPYPDFVLSAVSLDYRRLGKQRLEGHQVHRALTGKSTGWINHPAVKMWRGYEDALALYVDTVIEEWLLRGYRNTLPFLSHGEGSASLPPWLGREDFHASHRSNLLRKDPVFYGEYGWTEGPDLPYVWPV